VAAATNVPFGIKVPSENVKSFNALRVRVTDESIIRMALNINARAITKVNSLDALALLEEAINFSHFA